MEVYNLHVLSSVGASTCFTIHAAIGHLPVAPEQCPERRSFLVLKATQRPLLLVYRDVKPSCFIGNVSFFSMLTDCFMFFALFNSVSYHFHV